MESTIIQIASAQVKRHIAKFGRAIQGMRKPFFYGLGLELIYI